MGKHRKPLGLDLRLTIIKRLKFGKIRVEMGIPDTKII